MNYSLANRLCCRLLYSTCQSDCLFHFWKAVLVEFWWQKETLACLSNQWLSIQGLSFSKIETMSSVINLLGLTIDGQKIVIKPGKEGKSIQTVRSDNLLPIFTSKIRGKCTKISILLSLVMSISSQSTFYFFKAIYKKFKEI